MKIKKVRKYALCESRHELPPDVKESIYPHTVNLDSLDDLTDIADKVACQCKCDGYEMYVYVTGIQMPLVCVINACIKRDVKLTLWHWNPKKGRYVHQEINKYEGCDGK